MHGARLFYFFGNFKLTSFISVKKSGAERIRNPLYVATIESSLYAAPSSFYDGTGCYNKLLLLFS